MGRRGDLLEPTPEDVHNVDMRTRNACYENLGFITPIQVWGRFGHFREGGDFDRDVADSGHMNQRVEKQAGNHIDRFLRKITLPVPDEDGKGRDWAGKVAAGLRLASLAPDDAEREMTTDKESHIATAPGCGMHQDGGWNEFWD